MSVIKVTLPTGEIPAEGKQVSFKAPCPCDQTDAIQIEGVDYTACDALGNCVTGIGGVWDVGSIVSVILSPEQKKAYVQNNASYSPVNKPTPAELGALSDAGSGTYIGTGTSNGACSKTLTFTKAPKIVLVYNNTYWGFFVPGASTFVARYFAQGASAYEKSPYSLSGTTLTFSQSNANAGNNAASRLNTSGATHYYFAFG